MYVLVPEENISPLLVLVGSREVKKGRQLVQGKENVNPMLHRVSSETYETVAITNELASLQTALIVRRI